MSNVLDRTESQNDSKATIADVLGMTAESFEVFATKDAVRRKRDLAKLRDKARRDIRTW